jgi:hypothetical protein
MKNGILKTITWEDVKPHLPCYTRDGGSIPEWGKGSGTILDILSHPEISDEDKVWTVTRRGLITGDPVKDNNIIIMLQNLWKLDIVAEQEFLDLCLHRKGEMPRCVEMATILIKDIESKWENREQQLKHSNDCP